jgi:hypothetical protein
MIRWPSDALLPSVALEIIERLMLALVVAAALLVVKEIDNGLQQRFQTRPCRTNSKSAKLICRATALDTSQLFLLFDAFARSRFNALTTKLIDAVKRRRRAIARSDALYPALSGEWEVPVITRNDDHPSK